MAKAKSDYLNKEARKPHPIDVHVGRRIRLRRLMMDISQEKLADAVGLTFQQVQKYERGMNRVSASRLYQFSNILDVPISYFYEEFADGKRTVALQYGMADNDQDPFVSDEMLYAKESLELLKVYYSVPNENKRKDLFRIFRSMIDSIKSGD